MLNKKLAFVLVLVAALTLSGCFGEKVDPTQLKSISFAERPENLYSLDDTVTLEISGRNSAGEPIELKEIEWIVSDPNVGTLNSSDPTKVIFTPTKGGNVKLTVSAQDNVNASVDLTFADIGLDALVPGSPFLLDGGDAGEAGDLDGHKDPRGYEGAKIASNWNNKGHWIEWGIEIPEKADYYFVMRYAAGTSPDNPRKRDLRISGSEDALLEEILLNKSSGESFGRDAAGWNFYISEKIISLDAGMQTFRMENIGGDGEGVNVAWLGFVKLDPIDVDIDSDFLIEMIDEKLEMPMTNW